MKKCMMIFLFSLLITSPAATIKAQIPVVDIVKEAIKKAIMAIDLKVQQLQNKTIWLQNAQKELEDKMAQLKLDEISGWADKQKKLYEDYYQELKKVKETISTWERVKKIVQDQLQLVREYKSAYTRFQQDGSFSVDEITVIGNVYSGIIDESVKNLDELMLAVNSFSTQMSDARRLELIDKVARHMSENLADVRKFNQQNTQLALQRKKEAGDIKKVQQLYGIQKN